MAKMSVVCTVCGERLEWEQDECWGMVELMDMGCVSVTANDKGLLREHMQPHLEDGSWHKRMLEYMSRMGKASEAYAEREKALKANAASQA